MERFNDEKRLDEDPSLPGELRSLLTALHEDAPSAAALARLSSAVELAAGQPRSAAAPGRRLPWRATAAAIAAAAVIVVGAFGLLHRSRPAASPGGMSFSQGEGGAAAMVSTAPTGPAGAPAPEPLAAAPAYDRGGLLVPAGSAPPLPAGQDLATLDFESAWEAASPTRRIAGRRVQGPPGGVGGRTSIAGVIFTPEQKSFGVQVRDDAGLFPYADDILVAFDYWIGEWTAPEPPQMVFGLQFGETKTGYEYEMPVPDPVAVRWMTAVVRLEGLRAPFERDRSGRLKDFRASTPTARQRRSQPDRPQAGDIATMFKIRVEGVRQDVLFVDNIRIIRPSGR